MKKIFFIFTALIFLIHSNIAFGKEFLPRYMDSVKYFGIGVYFAPEETLVYSEPNENSKLAELIQWNKLGVKAYPVSLSSSQAFIAFLPEKKIALFSVISDTDDFYEIIYNHTTGAKGWIKKESSDKFLTWFEFMNKYGKKNGLYLFADLPEHHKIVHTGPGEDSQIIENCFYYPTGIKLKFIRGNWMLVRIIDYNKQAPIGWIRWRSDDGKIFLFPDLDAQN